MRIVVALKFVPDIASERRFEASRLVRDPADGSLNELDENAVEAALRLVEVAGAESGDESVDAHEVIAITMGPDAADLALRKAFQMGATRGIRLSDDALTGSDYFGTTTALAALIRRLGAETPIDLVVTGQIALDSLGAVLPVLLAQDLGWPALTHAKSVELAGRTLSVERAYDDVVEQAKAELPAVVSVTDSANTVRMPNFKLIMAARTKQIEVVDVAALDLDPDTVGAAGARAVVVQATPAPPRPPCELVVDKGEGGKALADFLIERELV